MTHCCRLYTWFFLKNFDQKRKTLQAIAFNNSNFLTLNSTKSIMKNIFFNFDLIFEIKIMKNKYYNQGLFYLN